MKQNVKIAKELMKLAKNLVALDDVQMLNNEQNSNNIHVSCFYNSDAAYQDRQCSFNYYGKGRTYDLAVEQGIEDSKQVFEIFDVQELFSYDRFADYREESYKVIPFEKVKQIIKATGNIDEINKNCEKKLWDYTEFASIDEFLEYIEGYDSEVYVLNDEAVNAIVEASKPYHSIPSFDEIYNGDYEEYGLELKDGYDSCISRGYSQGDVIRVIYKTQDFNKEIIDHILWDVPISCVITINGKEYYIDDYLKDIYNYDKDEVMDICERIIPDFEKYRDQIDELLPKNSESLY